MSSTNNLQTLGGSIPISFGTQIYDANVGLNKCILKRWQSTNVFTVILGVFKIASWK